MALWAGSNLNTTRLAKTWNQLWNNGAAINVVSDMNALLYMLRGKKTPNPGGGFDFERIERVTGNKIELTFMAKLDSVPTVADGSGELASSSATWAADYFGGSEFDWTHYNLKPAIPVSEWVKIAGNELKGEKFFKERFGQIVASIEETIGNGINSTTAVSNFNTSIGTWRHALSDGTTSGESGYDTYGVTRSDAGNVDFQGNVTAVGGALTTRVMKRAQLEIISKGGMPDLGLCGIDVYESWWNEVAQYSHVVNDSKMTEFKGEWVRFGSTVYALEQRAGDNIMGLLTTKNFKFWYREIDLFNEKTLWMRDPGLKAGYVAPFDIFAQLLCNSPRTGGILTGIVP